MDYEAQKYLDLLESGVAGPYWGFLNERDNLIRMETASFLGRPAVEPLSPYLLQLFGEDVRQPRLKQMIGHMVRQVMAARGYEIDRGNVRISQPNLFASGTRYQIADTGDKMMNRQVVKYGRYQLIAGGINGKTKAIAYLNDRKILECEGADIEEALITLKAALDARLQARQAKRREPHIGTVDDYVEALNGLHMTDNERTMLIAHAHAPNQTLTATQLAKSAGYKTWNQANSIYGTLGKKVGEAAGLEPKLDEQEEYIVRTFSLASGEGEPGAHWRWTMHPELLEALKKLNIV